MCNYGFHKFQDIFNEIESEFSGELVHVYLQDGTPVEYGQELFVLKVKDV